MMMWLAVGGACIALVALIALYYYFFDAVSIDEEEADTTEHETLAERAQVLAKHREEIEEEKIEQMQNIVVGDD